MASLIRPLRGVVPATRALDRLLVPKYGLRLSRSPANIKLGAASSLFSRTRCYHQTRCYSHSTSVDEPAKTIEYDQVAKFVESPNDNIIIVDVREPDEYAQDHIPGAVNIPFRSSPGALGLNPEEFKENFKFEKPDASKTLVFYCKSGVRSTGAEQLAATYGYKNRLNYVGSFFDWTSKRQQQS